jgi:hypothetical protein
MIYHLFSPRRAVCRRRTNEVFPGIRQRFGFRAVSAAERQNLRRHLAPRWVGSHAL